LLRVLNTTSSSSSQDHEHNAHPLRFFNNSPAMSTLCTENPGAFVALLAGTLLLPVPGVGGNSPLLDSTSALCDRVDRCTGSGDAARGTRSDSFGLTLPPLVARSGVSTGDVLTDSSTGNALDAASAAVAALAASRALGGRPGGGGGCDAGADCERAQK
jgi:hypothetical protein